MRCVGSMNPPCDRCAKAKRQCIITNRVRTQPSQARSSSVAGHDEKRRASEHSFVYSGFLNQRDDFRRSENSFPALQRESTTTTLPDRSTRSPEQSRHPASQAGSTSSGDVTADSQPQRHVVLPSVFSTSSLNIADLESAYLDESPGESGSRSGHGARSSVSTATTYGSGSSEEIVLTAVERDIYHLVDL